MRPLTLLYRGPLASCNYACEYCPFAKRRDSRAQLSYDRRCLERLVDWASRQGGWRLRLFFTPWGEALTRRAYRDAIVRLCQLDHVEKVVVQTNLSGSLAFASRCQGKLALWATYHPDWVRPGRFLRQCRTLLDQGVPFSVGMVGFPRFRQAMASMRQALPPSVYLWINAVKSLISDLDPADRAFFSQIDPYFEWNTQPHPSQGRACGGGSTVIAVDGEGTMRTCHFQPQPLGNLYQAQWHQALRPRRCQSTECRCHIGYAHLEYLELDRVFGSGILERIPVSSSLPPPPPPPPLGGGGPCHRR